MVNRVRQFFPSRKAGTLNQLSSKGTAAEVVDWLGEVLPGLTEAQKALVRSVLSKDFESRRSALYQSMKTDIFATDSDSIQLRATKPWYINGWLTEFSEKFPEGRPAAATSPKSPATASTPSPAPAVSASPVRPRPVSDEEKLNAAETSLEHAISRGELPSFLSGSFKHMKSFLPLGVLAWIGRDSGGADIGSLVDVIRETTKATKYRPPQRVTSMIEKWSKRIIVFVSICILAVFILIASATSLKVAMILLLVGVGAAAAFAVDPVLNLWSTVKFRLFGEGLALTRLEEIQAVMSLHTIDSGEKWQFINGSPNFDPLALEREVVERLRFGEGDVNNDIVWLSQNYKDFHPDRPESWPEMLRDSQERRLRSPR